MVVRVQKEDFDPGFEMELLTRGNTRTGGLCMFIGSVRESGERGLLNALFIEHYPRMSELQLSYVELMVRDRWLVENTLIIHRFGTLLPGDRIVMVATTAFRRDQAFESCCFIVDWLKTEAPFWKQEQTNQGAYWLDK